MRRFYLVGDVGDSLHCLTQVVASSLRSDHFRVDGTSGAVGCLREVLVYETLVVAQVQVGFAAVVRDEYLAVLVRVHSTWVDIDVRVELEHRHLQATSFQQPSERGRCEAFAESADHATGDENMSGHLGLMLSSAVRAAVMSHHRRSRHAESVIGTSS